MQADPADPRPAYERIANDFRELIAAGTLRPGDQLPSLAEITKRYGVAIMTAREAIKVLRTEGFVFTRQGVATFVSDNPPIQREPATITDLVAQFQRIETALGDLDDRVSAIERTIGRHAEQPPQDSERDG